MGDAHADISKHVRAYIGVFVALAIATVVTVAASTVNFGGRWNMVIALAIALLKASLVAAIFMHLKWEKSVGIWWTLGICAILFVALMSLPVLTSRDLPAQSYHGTWDVLPAAAHGEAGHAKAAGH
jgi:caa(3)-type oxidase subunit IV